MIIGFFGDLGQGKTISAVKCLRELWEGGYTIYSNIWLSFPHKKLEISFLINLMKGESTIEDNAVIFIDEIALYMDSRGSGTSKQNKEISYLLLQTRKLSTREEGIYILYTTQFPQLIDLRLWAVTSVKVISEKTEFMNYTIIDQTWIFDKIRETTTEKDSFIANDYFKDFNTKEIVRIQ